MALTGCRIWEGLRGIGKGVLRIASGYEVRFDCGMVGCFS